jgi:hypothetical protein
LDVEYDIQYFPATSAEIGGSTHGVPSAPPFYVCRPSVALLKAYRKQVASFLRHDLAEENSSRFAAVTPSKAAGKSWK